MISALQSSTSTKDTSHLDLVLKPSKLDFTARHLVHSPNSSILNARNLLTDISNTVHCSPTTASVNGTSVDDLSSLLSHPTIHFGRVAPVDRHDTDAWTQERTVHDTKFNAVTPSSSLGSNGTVADDYFPVDVAWNSFALMELQTVRLRTVEQFPNPARLREDAAVRAHGWTSLVAPSPGGSPVRPNVNTGLCWREDLSEGRRRVGEILVRCGVISVSPIEPTTVGCGDTSGAHPVGAPVISKVTAEFPFGETDGLLVTALADWTSEWVHTLVIQPYLQGGFRFQYQGKPSRASTSVALRIRRVLSDVENPVQVAIYALWFIGTLTGNGAHDNAPFLSVPIFRYFHNNGAFFAEDFMFRTFVTCAMIGDKTVNDTTLSTNTWNRLTRIPQVILNATEKHALSCLKWNTVMTRIQWQDTVVYLRSCIKMGSAFDPFAYDGASPSAIMAGYLDELINLSYESESDETRTYQQGAFAVEIYAPQPIQPFTHWEVFDTAEWCPKDDPVINQKPRAIGIAPGADHNSSTLKVGQTAKDYLTQFLGPVISPTLPISRNLQAHPSVVHLASLELVSLTPSELLVHAKALLGFLLMVSPYLYLHDTSSPVPTQHYLQAGFYPLR